MQLASDQPAGIDPSSCNWGRIWTASRRQALSQLRVLIRTEGNDDLLASTSCGGPFFIGEVASRKQVWFSLSLLNGAFDVAVNESIRQNQTRRCR